MEYIGIGTSVVMHCNPADARVIFNSSLVAFFNDTNMFCLHRGIEHVLPASFKSGYICLVS